MTDPNSKPHEVHIKRTLVVSGGVNNADESPTPLPLEVLTTINDLQSRRRYEAEKSRQLAVIAMEIASAAEQLATASYHVGRGDPSAHPSATIHRQRIAELVESVGEIMNDKFEGSTDEEKD